MVYGQNLPIGWSNCFLVDFCCLNMGQSPDSSTYNDNGEGLPFYQGKTEFGLIYPKPTQYCSKPKKIADAGDVLLSVRAPVGPTNLLNHKACIGRGLAAVKPCDFIPSKFILYLLRSIENELSNAGTGTTFKAITKDYLLSVKVNLPPIQEQDRIVAKIEELFSELDKGVESLKVAQKQLRVYRQAVLKWAFEGKLTGPENNIEHVRLEEVCEFITKGTTPAKECLFGGTGEIPFIKVYNLTFSGRLDYSIDPTSVSAETHNGFLARSKVLPGDVLMNIVGPPLGKVSIVPDTFPEWNINQAIARFRCRGQLYNKFLAYFLMADYNIEKTKKRAKATAGQFNLTLEICRDIEIPLYSINEQQQIVREFESRLSVCDKMEETIEQSLAQAEALRQSILKKAFEGRLVPQDPNDEPADKLLARIRAEREGQQPVKKATMGRTKK